MNDERRYLNFLLEEYHPRATPLVAPALRDMRDEVLADLLAANTDEERQTRLDYWSYRFEELGLAAKQVLILVVTLRNVAYGDLHCGVTQ